MSSTGVMPSKGLEQRLAEAEATIQALLSGQIDAVVYAGRDTPVLLAKAQDALRESVEEFRLLAEAVPQIVWITRPDGWNIYFNQLWFDYTGLTPAESHGHGWNTPFHSDDRERARKAWQSATATGGVYSLECQLRRADGVYRWWLIRGVPTKNSDGAILKWFGTCTDIHDLKMAELDLSHTNRALKQGEKILEQAQAVAHIGSWVSDSSDEGALTWSKETMRIFGFAPGEFDDRLATFFAAVHPDDRDAVRAASRAALDEGAPYKLEHRIVRPDGVVRWVRESAEIERDADGQAVRMIGVVKDISDSRKAAADVRDLEERLRQSQKMEAVGRLAGGVAHDFNNLLTVISGYSEALVQGLEPGPLRDAAQEVRSAGSKAAGLTNQLLAFSRKQTLAPEVLDVGEVVGGMTKMIQRLIGEDIDVRVSVAPDLGRSKVDRSQLEQVLINLSVNARDAMPGGGSLHFELQNVELDDAYASTHAEVTPGRYVLLAVSDTGTGMDEETKKRVFEPFFTTKEAGKGTGLGLATVYGIVLQSGGSVSLYSELGRGTTFKVYLPLLAGDGTAIESVSSGKWESATGSGTVFVVEDDAAIRRLTKVILQKAGYSVHVAENPEAAERLAADHSGAIDLLLTDVVMPGMKGDELAKRLRLQRPGLRVLFMSGYTDDAVVRHGILDEGTNFLQKPFTPHRLTQKIRDVLGRPTP